MIQRQRCENNFLEKGARIICILLFKLLQSSLPNLSSLCFSPSGFSWTVGCSKKQEAFSLKENIKINCVCFYQLTFFLCSLTHCVFNRRHCKNQYPQYPLIASCTLPKIHFIFCLLISNIPSEGNTTSHLFPPLISF